MRSRTWFYFLWGERGNVLLTTWGLVFSPKQKRGEITYFKPFSRHTCCDFGNHVYSLAHTTAPMQTFEIQFFRKREMSDVSSVGKCCLFYFTCIPVLPGRDTDINSGTVFHASLVKVCKPIPVSQETIGSQKLLNYFWIVDRSVIFLSSISVLSQGCHMKSKDVFWFSLKMKNVHL